LPDAAADRRAAAKASWLRVVMLEASMLPLSLSYVCFTEHNASEVECVPLRSEETPAFSPASDLGPLWWCHLATCTRDGSLLVDVSAC
jgi:hypothetical protein